ncbi:MAG: hypothetical protein EXQ84_05130 [Rhodospirillaceae bacterium]|nr:hypothetical protein [Rhodospirillaceae bacterium]
MAGSVPVMTRVTPEVKKRLRAIAKSSERSEAFLAREAIEQFVERNDWQIAVIEGRLADMNSGGETVPHDKVERWLDAKAAGKKLPIPKGRA